MFVRPTVWLKPWSIVHFYARTFIGFLIDHPMLLSQLRIFPSGIDFYADDLDDVSVEFQKEEAAWTGKEYRILQSYDRESLDDKLSYDVLEGYLADAVESGEFRFHGYPLNQMSGPHTGLPDFMINTHPDPIVETIRYS